jgi:hypothetical protein
MEEPSTSTYEASTADEREQRLPAPRTASQAAISRRISTQQWSPARSHRRARCGGRRWGPADRQLGLGGGEEGERGIRDLDVLTT